MSIEQDDRATLDTPSVVADPLIHHVQDIAGHDSPMQPTRVADASGALPDVSIAPTTKPADGQPSQNGHSLEDAVNAFRQAQTPEEKTAALKLFPDIIAAADTKFTSVEKDAMAAFDQQLHDIPGYDAARSDMEAAMKHLTDASPHFDLTDEQGKKADQLIDRYRSAASEDGRDSAFKDLSKEFPDIAHMFKLEDDWSRAQTPEQKEAARDATSKDYPELAKAMAEINGLQDKNHDIYEKAEDAEEKMHVEVKAAYDVAYNAHDWYSLLLDLNGQHEDAQAARDQIQQLQKAARAALTEGGGS